MHLSGIASSPWTVRALWAVLHHGLPLHYHEHTLMLGNPVWRWQFGQWTGPVTVPAARTVDGAVLTDSLAIAHYADEVGRGEPLFGPAAVEDWVRAADRLARAGRAASVTRLLDDDRALLDSLPGWARPLGRANLPLARRALRYLGAKWGFELVPRPERTQAMAAELEHLRHHLGDRNLIISNRFTFADIAMASALHFVRPSTRWIQLPRSATRSWSQPELAADYEDLLAWRDQVFDAWAPASPLLVRAE